MKGSPLPLDTMLLQPRILPRFFFISTSTPTRLYPFFRPLAFNSTLIPSVSATPDLSISIPPSFSDDAQSISDDPQLHLPLEKLFIPPDVQLPKGPFVSDGRVLKGSNIVLGPYARDAQVSTAEFVKSSKKTEDCPADGLPEFALVGRSNVGKSSLLNSLVRRKRLALTSKKPGR